MQQPDRLRDRTQRLDVPYVAHSDAITGCISEVHYKLDLMGRLAKDDPVFEDGFLIEDYDARNWSALADPIKKMVLAEAEAGNKAFCTVRHRAPDRIHIQLRGPARVDWSKLPEGVVLKKGFTDEFPMYDSELYAIFHIASGHSVSFADPDDRGIPQ